MRYRLQRYLAAVWVLRVAVSGALTVAVAADLIDALLQS